MTSDEASNITTSVEKVERTVNVHGIQTHMFEAGSPASAPLFYLHGTFLGNLWLEYHNALAQNFHVFAPDIPGFGLTERPNWMRDMSDYILYFRDLLDTLGLDRTRVVGHSLGGWTRSMVPRAGGETCASQCYWNPCERFAHSKPFRHESPGIGNGFF
jgi:alpha-beta hydrolase superfamily lysophospholipase